LISGYAKDIYDWDFFVQLEILTLVKRHSIMQLRYMPANLVKLQLTTRN